MSGATCTRACARVRGGEADGRSRVSDERVARFGRRVPDARLVHVFGRSPDFDTGRASGASDTRSGMRSSTTPRSARSSKHSIASCTGICAQAASCATVMRWSTCERRNAARSGAPSTEARRRIGIACIIRCTSPCAFESAVAPSEPADDSPADDSAGACEGDGELAATSSGCAAVAGIVSVDGASPGSCFRAPLVIPSK